MRLLPDGTSERSVGGTGLLPGLGGPVAPWHCPFTRDGRFMAFASGCEDGETCALLVYTHFPYGDGEEGRLDRIALPSQTRPNEVLLSEDASVAVTCVRTGDDGELFWMNRAIGERADVPISRPIASARRDTSAQPSLCRSPRPTKRARGPSTWW